MKNISYKKNGFLISTDPSLIQIGFVHNYLATESYWARGRSIDVVRRSIENSLCFGVYRSHEQTGFARVVTDYSVFAYLLDVFIMPSCQGQGLGKWLISCIMAHPDLQNRMKWALCTRDAHGLYRQYHFTALSTSDCWMELDQRKSDTELEL